MTGFRGWPQAGLEFLEGLEADNSRDYFQANKATYTESVAGPMQDLITDLTNEFGDGKMFRPNRDVRFSKDKSPYKTNCAAVFTGGGYVSYSTEGLGVGAGYYMLEPPQLAAYREAVADDKTGGALEKIVSTVKKAGAEISAHDVLKTAPRGYPPDHPRIELLRHKGLIAWWQFPAAKWLSTAKAKDKVVTSLRASRPLLDWLDANVGR